MKNKNQEKQTKSNPFAAVATGVVIGAGVAAAGTAILQDKRNREKVKKVVNDVKKQVSVYMEDMQKMAQEKKEEGTEKVQEGKKELKKKTEESIDSVQDTLEETKKNL